MNATSETEDRLTTFTKDETYEFEVPGDITKELAKICREVQWGEPSQVKLYIEGAARALAMYQRAKASEEGTPIYGGPDFEKGQLASKNAKAIAQYLYRNKWSMGFHAAIGGENQLFTVKLLDSDGNSYALQLFPDRASGAVDVLLEPWEPVEL